MALLTANIRYWTGVAPLARAQMRRWERRAEAIEDPELQALALSKLRGEGFNAEAATMLATLAPRRHRQEVVEAIVALEVIFDYLDGLTERPTADPLGEGRRLFAAFTEALALGSAGDGGKPHRHPQAGDGGYLEELSGTVRKALAGLPAADAIADVAQGSAARSAEAQIRMHAAPHLGMAQLREWADREAEGTGLEWRELLAGAAASVLALHALIAAAADPRTTREEAAEIEAAYLSICVLPALLDGVIDRERDERAGMRAYIDLYDDRDQLAQTLAAATGRAAAQARGLRDGSFHVMTLAGVVAYYTSAREARTPLARPVTRRLNRELAPLILPLLAIMRTWRMARRARGRLRVGPRTRPRRRIGVAVGLGALGVAVAGVAMPAHGAPRAAAARLLSVREEGNLRFVSSAGEALLDEGPTSGTIPGRTRVSFVYDGSPAVTAHFRIYGSAGTIVGWGEGRLNNPNSPRPSFRGRLTITGGSRAYAHARGSGELFGVFDRRSYGLQVQAIGRLRY